MRINNNIASLTALRNLTKTNHMTHKNLERLSSGMKINSAADGPAQLMISEHLRAQIAGMDQAMRNSEAGISMVQTAEGALGEVSNILVSMRQLAIHAANSGANDTQMLQADQAEIENLLGALDRIAENTQFGTRNLLDGSNEISGVGVGSGIEFVSAAVDTPNSSNSGYAVDIRQVATRTTIEGKKRISIEDAEKGIKFTIHESEQAFSLDTSDKRLQEDIDLLITNHRLSPEINTREDTEEAIAHLIARELQHQAKQNSLHVDVFINELGMLTIRHQHFGSDHTLSATSDADGIISEKANESSIGVMGKDVVGSINGELAIGQGQELKSSEGTSIAGLVIKYTNTIGKKVQPILDPNTKEVIGEELVYQDSNDLIGDDVDGYVHLNQNSLAYHVGPNQGQLVKVSVQSTNSQELARDVENESRFRSLADIDVTEPQGAQDALELIDKAIEEVSHLRGKLGAVQKNSLESNLSFLRVASEQLINAESTIRDTDMASEMSDFTKNQILLASGTAMAAQANQIPKSVLQLLQGVQ